MQRQSLLSEKERQKERKIESKGTNTQRQKRKQKKENDRKKSDEIWQQPAIVVDVLCKRQSGVDILRSDGCQMCQMWHMRQMRRD